MRQQLRKKRKGRSREGAWIEIVARDDSMDKGIVAPARERGLKCCVHEAKLHMHNVAPARERGLKCNI